jgi:hypothetical protein
VNSYWDTTDEVPNVWAVSVVNSGEEAASFWAMAICTEPTDVYIQAPGGALRHEAR